MHVFAATWQRWRSHHSIRNSRKPHAARKLHGSMFYRTGVTADWSFTVLRCGNREVRVYCCCDLDLDPMTFIYELDPYPLKIPPQTKNELSTPRLSKVIVLHTRTHTVWYRQTPPNTLPRRLAGSNNYVLPTETRDVTALHNFKRQQKAYLFHIWRTEWTVTTARHCCDVFVIMAPDIKLHTYLLTYLLTRAVEM